MKFYKYQSCGNDFIITEKHIFHPETIRSLCDRHFGIGADGLIFVEKNQDDGFNIKFYNSDGSTDTFCGNGSLCAVNYAVNFLEVENEFFYASDGKHYYKMLDGGSCEISLNNTNRPSMILFNQADKKMTAEYNLTEGFFCNIGSPHFVLIVDDVDKVDVMTLGKYFRENINKYDGGTNVDFVTVKERGVLEIRTFERGVENETLSCGTGSVAAAITYTKILKDDIGKIVVNNKGGSHVVSFYYENDFFTDIKLQSKPQLVFTGEINI